MSEKSKEATTSQGSKSLLKSKIFWANIISLLSSVLVMWKGADAGIPAEMQGELAVAIPMIVNVISILLRTITSKPVHIRKKPDA